MIQVDDHIFFQMGGEKPPTLDMPYFFATNLKMMFLFCHDLLVSWTYTLDSDGYLITSFFSRLEPTGNVMRWDAQDVI